MTSSTIVSPLFFFLLSVLPVLGRYISPMDRILSQKDVDFSFPPLVATMDFEDGEDITSDDMPSTSASRFISLLEDLVNKRAVDVESSQLPSSSLSSSYSWSSLGSSGDAVPSVRRALSGRSGTAAVGTAAVSSDDALVLNRARAARTRTHVRRPWRQNEMDCDGVGIDMPAPFTSKYVAYTNASYGICGVRPTPPGRNVQRIVVGSGAANRWPWQVMLVNATTGEPFCGATLITNEHVLTAAHCFDGKDTSDITVRIGEHDRSFPEGSEMDFDIECLHVHRCFEPDTYRYDIALIKLATSDDHRVVFSDHVRTACLPEEGEFEESDTCYVTGWGYTGFVDFFLGRRPNVLQEATVPLLSNRECKDAYGTRVKHKMVCAGTTEPGERADTCKGDSGGPMVCQSRNEGPFKLWGITSWGDNFFCNPDPSTRVPGVYTRVDKYLKWIQRKLRTKKCPT
ncbi:chymotrypsinogen A-like [Diadema setosum]|uniref:chymotrypsinogen A-like n=1 Tax=Diadema setosum TaxID=31175 RepID=UPI003B3BDDD5